MKKLLFSLLTIISLSAFSQDTTGHFYLKVHANDAEALLNLINKSSESHTIVVFFYEDFLKQFKSQMPKPKVTTKPNEKPVADKPKKD